MERLSPASLIDLAGMLGILALVALLYTQVILRSSRSTRLPRRLFLGLLFGAGAMLAMMRPVAIAPGVFVDVRNVLVALAGPFGGWLSALVATVLAASYRVWTGGAGALAGTVSLVLSGAAGLAVYHLGRSPRRPSVLAGMSILAALTGVATALAFMLLPKAVLLTAMQSTLVPVVLVNGAGIILLGLFLNRELDRRRIELALARSSRELSVIAENVSDMIAVVDQDGFYTYVSRSCERLLGYVPEDLIGRNAYELFHPDDVQSIRDAVRKLLSGEEETTVLDYRARRNGGEWTWVETSTTLVLPRNAEGEPFFVAVSRDVTEHHRAMSELHGLANSDALTGLANRRYFDDVGQAEFARWRRYGHPLTLLVLDLDNLKPLNDIYGHLAGDRALQALAGILRRESRSVDTAARIGGDEFAVLLPDTTPESGAQLARRIRAAVAYIEVGDEGIRGRVSVSIGIAGAGDGTDDFRALVSLADQKMYEAKQAARSGSARIAPAGPEM